nr:putative peptidoglycan glycosyltransferase FtsW [uncultured Agathobaculum sp.]
MAFTNRQTRPVRRPADGSMPRPSDAVIPHEQHLHPSGRTQAPSRTRSRAHAWDAGVFFSVMLLMIIGLIALFSASYTNAMFYQGSATHFIAQQGGFALLGVIAMIVISNFNYHIYARFSSLIMTVSIVLLILVAIPGIGTVRNYSRRWLFGFQPSELAKIAVIICFAYWIARNSKSIRSFKGLIRPYGFLLAAYCVLLFLEPHTSAMLIICGTGVLILVAGGMRLWYFVPISIAGAAAVTVFYFSFPHVRDRFAVWLDPFANLTEDGWQGAMGQIAIGSGGLFGLGLGNSVQKQLYLPEPQNDFIFAIWCEEMGLIGALLVMLLFGYLIVRGFRIAQAAPDKFGFLLATGITIKLAIQTLMNLFVVTGLIPVTGASLPFFSYGGTALLMQLGEMGILLNVSRYMRAHARQEE